MGKGEGGVKELQWSLQCFSFSTFLALRSPLPPPATNLTQLSIGTARQLPWGNSTPKEGAFQEVRKEMAGFSFYGQERSKHFCRVLMAGRGGNKCQGSADSWAKEQGGV